jgi:hypothetical protein
MTLRQTQDSEDRSAANHIVSVVSIFYCAALSGYFALLPFSLG